MTFFWLETRSRSKKLFQGKRIKRKMGERKKKTGFLKGNKIIDFFLIYVIIVYKYTIKIWIEGLINN
jgi:hypothetical protein